MDCLTRMSGGAVSYRIAKILEKEGAEAHRFHAEQALDPHVWPREEKEIRRMVEDGALYGARVGAGQLVGLCYSMLDDEESWVELGGLTVLSGHRKTGIGTCLAACALAIGVVEWDPWVNGWRVVAHVHDENDKPRRLLKRLGFEWARKVTIPGENAPLTLRRNEDGNITGDEFEFLQASAAKLADRLHEQIAKTKADIDLPRNVSLEKVTKVLRELSC